MSSSPFVNTLPYISNPVEEFRDFRFVSREAEIYPKLVGQIPEEESAFFADIISKRKLKKILDLGLGGGKHLSALIDHLQQKTYPYTLIEANEIDTNFISQAKKRFLSKDQEVVIHQSNWLDLPEANPPYTEKFDFVFLTGNSLTYIGGGSRLYTKLAQKSIINKFASMIESGGYFFLDTRDYDYIKSLMMLRPEEIMHAYTFNKKVHYYGTDKEIIVFPAYISDTVVVLHYYDTSNKTRSKLDLYPVYHNDIVETLSDQFEIEQIYYDYDVTPSPKCMLRQYLARKK